MPTKAEIHDKLIALKQQGKKEYLKILGVDLTKLRAFEKKQDAHYRKIEKSIRSLYKKSGKDVANRHQRSHARSLKLISRQLDYALNAQQQYPQIDKFLYLCNCHYPHTAEIKGNGEDISFYPYSGDLSEATVNFDSSANSSQLFARADSPYSGEVANASVKAWFKFAFTPDSDGTYCIRPMVHLNGYWMIWSGTRPSCEDYESLPVFGFHVHIKLRIEQLSDPVLNRSHEVMNGPVWGDFSSAFDYDSEINHDLNVEVDLLGGDQTVVFVECDIDVFANNGLHSRVDMQTSPHFYFQVPTVKWGKPCPSRYLMRAT